MLLTVDELRTRVDRDLPSLVNELSELTGRGGEGERWAWQRSLPRLADALIHPSLERVHVHFARREHHVALEYQLPGAASWCDVVLLGRHGTNASAVVIELKDWETNRDRPGKAEGLIERRGVQELHPSDQVKGYVEYCRMFHSAVLNNQASVHGFVLFTTGLLKHPYVVDPNAMLAENFPIFSMAEEDISSALPNYLSTRLSEQDYQFATEFATGTFQQDRRFMSQVGRTILDGDTRHFELLDNQRRAFHLCLATTRELLASADAGRRVILVDGPPGSGKSAVAARTWASLVVDKSVCEGNIVLVTTSQSQSCNWVYLINQATTARVGRGVARKATSFSPMDIAALSRLRKQSGNKDLYRSAAEWRQNLQDLASAGTQFRPGAESDSVLVSLVDEAHALIDPGREHGVGQFGFVTGLGPQAYHIIRCSRLTVFFLDPDQSFRARENTRAEDIEKWAQELGATVERVSLRGAQFRCAGSAEYVGWLESLLGGASEEINRVFASAWYEDQLGNRPEPTTADRANVIAFRRRAENRFAVDHRAVASDSAAPYGSRVPRQRRPTMDFRIYPDPFSMEVDLRSLSKKYTVRLVSTYSRDWKTRESTYPHRLPPQALDFCEPVMLANGEQRNWSRPWNFVPDGDYTGFVAGRMSLPISEDPLCEVGCTYAVRGFDFQYLGLLWLNDLQWRNDRWVVPLDNVHESGITPLVHQARREGDIAPAGPKGANVVEKVRQAYRILLTRAIHGVFVWIPDDETRKHVTASISKP